MTTVRQWLLWLSVIASGAATVEAPIDRETVPMVPVAATVVAYAVGRYGRTAAQRALGAAVVVGAPLVATRQADQGADLLHALLSASGSLAWPAAAFAAGLEIGRLRRRLGRVVRRNERQLTTSRCVAEAERRRVGHALATVIDCMRDDVFAQADLAENLLRSRPPHDVTAMAVTALNAASLGGHALAEIERVHRELRSVDTPAEPRDRDDEGELWQADVPDRRRAMAGRA